ncbi:MAG: DinB family protein [Bryobacteraceae bacterium]|jgi:hypothetical protein
MDTTRLDEAVDSFISFIRSLPPQALEASRTDGWGPREVLIHLVFWHEQYASIATAVAAKKPPTLHPGTIRAVNHLAVAQDAQTSVAALIARWTKANRQFAAVASKRSAAGLRIPLREKSKAWPLDDLIRLAAGHIEKHQAKLRKTLYKS